MPTLDEALRFAADDRTTDAKLREACAILGLPETGDLTQVRARLIEHLRALDAAAPVVCLNPGGNREPAADQNALLQPGETE